MDRNRILTELRLSLGEDRPLGQRRDDGAIGHIRSPKEDTSSRHGRPAGQPALGTEMEPDSLK